MSEAWNTVTKERVRARQEFFEDYFPKWKNCFCQDMGKRDPFFLECADKIVWRMDKNGTVYSPACLSHLYFYTYRPKARRLMKDPSKFLDRHKIVALTQRLVLEHYPVTYSFLPSFGRECDYPLKEVRLLNVSFAYHFALEYLCAWNNELHKQKQFFEVDGLFKHLDSTDFSREHYKYLMLDLEEPFPTFLISQL